MSQSPYAASSHASVTAPADDRHPSAAPSASRRRWLGQGVRLAAASALAGTVSPLWANSSAPIRLLVGFPPGGGTDLLARLVAEPLAEALGRPVVVENRPGAGGQVAAQLLKAAPADGAHYFLSHDHTISILPLVMKNPGFDPAKDFVPVAGLATFANAFAVSGGSGVSDFAGYVEAVRAGKAKPAVGIPAPASVPEFMVRSIAAQEKLDLIVTPYRGGGPMMVDMLGNQIGAGVESVPGFIENHKAGKLRIVAVMGRERQDILPDVPTFFELGYTNFNALAYYGVFAPTGTPAAEQEAFAAALETVIATESIRQRLVAMGLTPGYRDAGTLGDNIAAYNSIWKTIIDQSGFKPL